MSHSPWLTHLAGVLALAALMAIATPAHAQLNPVGTIPRNKTVQLNLKGDVDYSLGKVEAGQKLRIRIKLAGKVGFIAWVTQQIPSNGFGKRMGNGEDIDLVTEAIPSEELPVILRLQPFDPVKIDIRVEVIGEMPPDEQPAIVSPPAAARSGEAELLTRKRQIESVIKSLEQELQAIEAALRKTAPNITP